jgi:hypothetical protein
MSVASDSAQDARMHEADIAAHDFGERLSRIVPNVATEEVNVAFHHGLVLKAAVIVQSGHENEV